MANTAVEVARLSYCTCHGDPSAVRWPFVICLGHSQILDLCLRIPRNSQENYVQAKKQKEVTLSLSIVHHMHMTDSNSEMYASDLQTNTANLQAQACDLEPRAAENVSAELTPDLLGRLFATFPERFRCNLTSLFHCQKCVLLIVFQLEAVSKAELKPYCGHAGQTLWH